MAQALYNSREKTVKAICQGLGITRATFYRYVKTDKRKKRNKIRCWSSVAETFVLS